MEWRAWPSSKISDGIIQLPGDVRNFIAPAQEKGHGANDD